METGGCRWRPATASSIKQHQATSKQQPATWPRGRSQCSATGPRRQTPNGSCTPGRPYRAATPGSPLFPSLRGEASQRAAHIALSQPLERTITKLPDALACDAEHRADLLQRVLPAAFESEVQSEDFGIACGEGAEGLFDLVIEEAVHRFFFRIRHFVGDEPLDQRAIAF